MGIRQWWDEKDKTLVRCEIRGEWTWEEFHEAMAQIRALARQVKYRVDMVIDLSEAGPLPMSAASLQLKNMLDRMPEHFGVTVLVTSDNYTRMVVESLDRVLPDARGRLYTTGTVNAARRIILLARSAKYDTGADAATRPIVPRFRDEDNDSSD